MSWGPSFWQTWPHCGFPTLPHCYLWVVCLIGGGYCTRHHKIIDGHHSESCLPWKDLNCGQRGEKSLSPMATSSIVSGLLWQLFIGPVPLMKDAHQCRDVKDTECPTTEESRLSLFMSVLCPLQLPKSQYEFLCYLHPKPPLSFSFVWPSLDDLHWRSCKISMFG